MLISPRVPRDEPRPDDQSPGTKETRFPAYLVANLPPLQRKPNRGGELEPGSAGSALSAPVPNATQRALAQASPCIPSPTRPITPPLPPATSPFPWNHGLPHLSHDAFSFFSPPQPGAAAPQPGHPSRHLLLGDALSDPCSPRGYPGISSQFFFFKPGAPRSPCLGTNHSGPAILIFTVSESQQTGKESSARKSIRARGGRGGAGDRAPLGTLAAPLVLRPRSRGRLPDS